MLQAARSFVDKYGDELLELIQLVGEELTKARVATWIIENVTPFLNEFKAKDIRSLVKANVSIWDEFVPEELKPVILELISRYKEAIPPFVTPEFLHEVLKVAKPALGRAITVKYLTQEMEKIVGGVQ